MSNRSENIQLFACCIPVKGARRSLICDLQRESIYFIPNALHDILVQYPVLDINEIAKNIPEKDRDTIIEYFDFLVLNELAFLTDTPESFPKMDLTWKSPNPVTNAIIDIKEDSRIWMAAAEQLAAINCKHVQLRFFSAVDLSNLHDILTTFKGTPLRSIELIMKYSEWMTIEHVTKLSKEHHRISSIVVYNAREEVDKNMELEMGKIVFLTENLDATLHCGKIHPTLFDTNIPTFTESLHHNSCLNRKISIDAAGNIKNCPSMRQSYGNIQDTSLQKALDHPDFKKYWNITKDQVAVCQDCEFRYICTDCRAYLDDPEDTYSKPLKCGYNPYSATWEEWSTNPLKQNAIDFYGMLDVLPEFKLKPDYAPPRHTSPVTA